MSSVFFTGFPGFLGVALLPRVLERHGVNSVADCLVQQRYINYAKKMLASIERDRPELEGRIRLHLGDVASPALGLDNYEELQKEAVEVYHLAAVHDLTAGREPARRVNVDGTRNVLSFAGGAGRLKRFHYVSDLRVSGRHEGLFRENDLEVGQRFNNHYESTKFEAEVSVHQAKSEGMPVTVYRPGLIAGDSDTGATQKYDGVYYLIRWVLSLPRLFVYPEFGGGTANRINIVPRDFVVEAVMHLGGLDGSEGMTYHLADPHPMPVSRLMRELGRLTGRRLLPLPVPKDAAKVALRYVRGLRRWMQIPPQALDYLKEPTRYAVDNLMTGLKGSGLHVPRLAHYLPNLIEFVRRHGEITSRPMA